MKQFIWTLLICPLVLSAQDKGIVFEQHLSWQQVLQKAKAENKFIFVDCYASWCGPCKMMDRDVYSSGKVGEIYNGQYIAVKVQMDRTESDDAQTKDWYSTADMLAGTYTINAYPTFLFFDPAGKPVHKVTGAMEVNAFIQLGQDVQDPRKQYYNVLNNFQPNTLDTAEEKGLIRLLATENRELAAKIAADYLSRIPKEQLSHAGNGRLMWEFQDNSQVLDIALGFIQANITDTANKNLLLFVDALGKQPKIIEWAADYVGKLDKTTLSSPNTGKLMISFQDNPKVLDIALSYIRDNFRKETIPFISALGKQPRVKQWAVDHITRLTPAEAGEEGNRELMQLFHTDPAVRQFAENYIDQLSEVDLYIKPAIELISVFTDTSAGRGFDVFFHHGKKVDEIMGDKRYAYGVVSSIAGKEEVSLSMKEAKRTGIEPDWDAIAKSIRQKFGKAYVEDNIVYNKMKWYEFKKDWPNCAKYMTIRMDKQFREQGIADSYMAQAFYWNNNIFNIIFQYDDNKNDLEKALTWIHQVNQMQNEANAGDLDTEANVLYKLGRKEEALKMETQATGLDPRAKDIAETLQKMKAGEPTWKAKQM